MAVILDPETTMEIKFIKVKVQSTEKAYGFCNMGRVSWWPKSHCNFEFLPDGSTVILAPEWLWKRKMHEEIVEERATARKQFSIVK